MKHLIDKIAETLITLITRGEDFLFGTACTLVCITFLVLLISCERERQVLSSNERIAVEELEVEKIRAENELFNRLITENIKLKSQLLQSTNTVAEIEY